MNKEFKYIKDHKTGNRVYPIVRSKGIVDAFNINEPQIDYLFNEVTDYFIQESTNNIILNPGSSTTFTIKLEITGPIDESDIKWESSNENVAIVVDGVVTAISAGNATITASSQLYNIHVEIPVKVGDPDVMYWAITYKSPTPVPHVMEQVPDTFRNYFKYWYSLTSAVYNVNTLIPANYMTSTYDSSTGTGKWFFSQPAMGIQMGSPVPYSNDLETVQGIAYMDPSYIVTGGNVPEEQKWTYVQDVSSITSLAYESGPEILQCLSLVNFSNIQELILPDTITTINLGTGLLGTLIYRYLPKVVQNMNYSYVLPKNITTITLTSAGSDAFGSNFGPGYDFSVFHYLSVDPNNQYYDSRENCNAIINTASNTLICGCRNTVIPSSVTALDESAFTGCQGIERLVIPGTIDSIYGPVFGNTSGNEIVLEEGVTTIDYQCFQGSTVQSVTLPVSLTYIGDDVFDGCTINYQGTMEQWEAISKGHSWNGGATLTINCSDGTITS